MENVLIKVSGSARVRCSCGEYLGECFGGVCSIDVVRHIKEHHTKILRNELSTTAIQTAIQQESKIGDIKRELLRECWQVYKPYV